MSYGNFFVQNVLAGQRYMHHFFAPKEGGEVHWNGMPAKFSVPEQVKSCTSVSCLINKKPLELLCLQPSELIA